MPRKGVTNNPNGRPKGKPNKVTANLRSSIQFFLEKNWPKVQKEFDKMEPKDKLVFYDKMLAYSLPKLQATSLSLNFEELTEDELDEIINRLNQQQ